MNSVAATLRADLRADLDALRGFDVADWLHAGLDTALTAGLVVRAMVHACVYAINHAEPGADTSYSLAAPPIAADCWRPRDQLQVSLLSVWLLAWVATPYAALPSAPLVRWVVIAQAVPLAVDPLVTLREVAR